MTLSSSSQKAAAVSVKILELKKKQQKFVEANLAKYSCDMVSECILLFFLDSSWYIWNIPNV